MKKILTLYLILSSFASFAQNKTIDSLQQELKDFDAQKVELHKNLLPDESDSSKVKILLRLCREFARVSDNAAAEKCADEALAIAQQIGFKVGIATAYSSLGNIKSIQANYPEALKNHSASLKMNQESGDKLNIAKDYNNIGSVYHKQDNYPEALKNYFASLKIKEEMGDKEGIGYSYGNIGVIYTDLGNYDEALKNHLAALKIREEIGDKHGIESSYTNIGNIYHKLVNYPEALKNYFAAVKICEEINDKEGLAYANGNIGVIYKKQGNYPRALEHLLAAKNTCEEIGDKDGLARTYVNLAGAKLDMHAEKEAKDDLMKGLLIAKEIGSVGTMKSCYEGIATADSALGNFKDAYENHKLYILYRDSLSNQEVTKKIVQSKMQYEFDKKESETKVVTDAELKKQKLLRNGFVGGFAVVLLFAGVFFRQRNKTKKEKQRSDELLLNILPGEVADEIITSGTAKAKAFTMVTVMFTDFKDFTTVSEKISAELLVDEIHTCFSAFDNILHKYKIEKIKTIGDAYLCASGLPVSTHTHAQDMLNAAFEIRSFMHQRKKEKEAKGEIPFELRIGIHTGPVVAGVVGVKKYAYDIWGDTVNIAARMEQNSEAGKINISGATYELVKDKFSCTHRGKIQAKNKGEIDMYFAEATSN